MKKFVTLILIFSILLSGCIDNNTEGTNNMKCNEGICLEYTFNGSIKAEEPIELLVELTIKADDPELQLAISTTPEIKSQGFTRIQDGQKPSTTNGKDMGWTMNAMAGDIYTFSGTLVFPKSTDNKIGQYWIHIVVVGPRTSHLSFMPNIILDSNGEQISPDELDRTNPVQVDIGTVPPVVTDNPGMEFPLSPTGWQETQQRLLLNTSTPTVTTTPTTPGYPAP
jgi:hypothetical protein